MKMVSALTAKTNKYSYYLANGAYVQYSLLPDSSLIELIDGLVSFYYAQNYRYWNDCVLVRPEIASALVKEACQRTAVLGNLPHSTGMQVLRLQTVAGTVTIETRPGLEWPIFVGSEQELKDNSFNASMEEILCE
jgi:hypothetical protein